MSCERLDEEGSSTRRRPFVPQYRSWDLVETKGKVERIGRMVRVPRQLMRVEEEGKAMLMSNVEEEEEPRERRRGSR